MEDDSGNVNPEKDQSDSRFSTTELLIKQPTAENKNLLSKEQAIRNNVTNKPPNEQGEAEGKNVIAKFIAEDESNKRPKVPRDLTESEGKIKISKRPCKKAEAKDEIKATEFSHEQAEAEGEITATEFQHTQAEAEGKITATEFQHTQAEAEGEIIATEFQHTQAEAEGEITATEFQHTQAEAEGEITATEFQHTQAEAEGEITATKFQHTQAEAEGEITATEFQHTQAEAEGEITATEFQHTQAEAEGEITATKFQHTQAEAEGEITATKFQHTQAEAEGEITATEFQHTQAEAEGEITATEFQHTQAEAKDEIKATEFQHTQAEAEGEITATKFQRTQAEAEDKIIITEPPIYQAAVTDKSITTPKLSHELAEAEGKIKMVLPYKQAEVESEVEGTKLPCKLAETEGEIRATELPDEQVEAEGKTRTTDIYEQAAVDKTTESQHMQEGSEDKNTTTEFQHTQAEAQEKFLTLQKIAKLLDDVISNKRQLEALIDEKKKRYEVDFIIAESFSVSKGKFESELQTDMECLDQALKQKEADKDNASQKCDQLSVQLAEQNGQIREFDRQLALASSLKLELKNKVSSLSNTICKLKEEINAKQKEITKTGKAIKENQKSIAEVEVSLKNSNKKWLLLCDEKSFTENDLEKNNQSIEKCNEIIAKIQKELKNTSENILYLKKKQKEKQSDMNDNEKSQSEHIKEVDKIKSDLEETTMKCDNLKTEKNQIQLSLYKLETEIEETCNQKSRLQQSCESNNQKLKLFRKQLDEHSKNIEKCKGDILKLEKDTMEFQESHNIFVLSCKVCLKFEIKEVQEKLTKRGFSCLKQLFHIWNDQTESLQKELEQVSKKVEEHEQLLMIREYSSTSLKPIQVLKDTELSYLEYLQSTAKNIYVLQAIIQHCLCQINVDGLIKVVDGNCNGSDEDQKNTSDANQNTVIHLGTIAEVHRKKLLQIGNGINSNFLKLTSTRLCDEKKLLTCIQEQETLWNEMQQLLELFAQNVIDIETKVDAQQIPMIFCHNYTAIESSLIDASINEELKRGVELLNEVYCSQNLVSIVDRQLAVLEKDNEELVKTRSSCTAEESLLAIQRKLECKESEMYEMETQKQQAQQELHYAQEKLRELTVAEYQLQKEIQKEELSLGEVIQTLSHLKQELQLKEFERNEITTKSLQLQGIQEKNTNCNIKLTEHNKKLGKLQQNLKEHQLELQKHDVDPSTDAKVKIIAEHMHKTQETIKTIETNIKSYELQLAQLDEADRKKSDLSKSIANLQDDINQHESSIGEIQNSLTNNASVIKECKAEEECKKVKICDTLNLLEEKNTEYNQFREMYIQCVVEMSIQKAVIDYQIEENEQKIKMLHEHKCSLSYEETSEIKTITDKQFKFEQQLHSFELDFQEKYIELKIQQNTVEFTERQIQEFEKSSNNISDELKHANTKFDLKRKERSDIQQEQKAMVVELEVLHQSIKKDMSQKLNNHEKILTQLNSKIQEMKDEISNFRSEISTKELKVKEGTKSLNNHKSNKFGLVHENKKLDLELKRVKNDLVEVDESISNKSSTLKDYQVRKENFENTLDKLQKQMDEIRKSMKQSEEERKTAQKASQKNVDEIEILNRKEKGTKDLLAKTEEDYRIWLQKRDNFQKEYNKLRVQWNDIECINKQKEEVYSTLEELEIQLDEIKQSKDMYNSTRSILKHILHMVEHENILEKHKAEKFKKEKQDLEDHRKTLENELNEQIKELENRINELKKQNNILEKQDDKLKNQKDILEKESYVIKKKIQELEQEIERLKQTKSGSLPRKIKGLVNLGNTCFFNSMLQGVNQVTMLYQLLRNEQRALLEYAVPSPSTGGKSLQLVIQSKLRPFAQALCTFYQEIDSDKYNVRPSSLLSLIGQKNSRFMGRNQQDSHEAFRCLLDALRSEEIQTVKEEIYTKFGTTEQEYRRSPKKFNPEDDKLLKGYLRKANKVITTVDKVFGGRLVNTIVCHRCYDITQTFEAFLDLSLPITKDKTISSSMKAASKKSICNDDVTLQMYLAKKGCYRHKPLPHDLELSLAEFTDLDELDDDNQFICKKCTTILQQKTGKDDDFALCNVSKSLIIDDPPKILVLHIKRFYLEPVVRKDNEHVSFDKDLDITSYCTTDCIKIHGGNIIYTLFAVVVHGGSLQSGHYTAYVNVTDDKWYYTSDSHISECFGGFKEVEKCQAYMLFYKQN